MPRRTFRTQSQTAFLAGSIHNAYEYGQSLEGAILATENKYGSDHLATIKALANKIYGERAILDSITDKNFGNFASLKSLFGCKGDSVVLTTYITFIDGNTGQVKKYGTDVVLSPLSKTFKLGDLFANALGEIALAAKAKGYNVPSLGEEFSIKELVKGQALSFKGFKCL